jgi:hypothetical protein
MSRVVTLRLPEATAQRLRTLARRSGRSISEVGARSIEEWLRQQEFADLEFRAFGGERHACLKGGPPIWQVIMVARDHDLDPERTAAHFGWPVERARAALHYYEVYPDEIDQALAENQALTYDQLKRLLPRTERLTLQLPTTAADAPS